MPTILLTGASAYIGGHTLQLITKQHPEWNILALIRNEAQAKSIQKQFPAIRTIVGSLEDLALLAKCSAEADVVLQLASSSRLTSSTSIISSMSLGKKGTFIQMSGISTLQNTPNGYGRPSDLLYNDVESETLANHFSPQSTERAVIASGERYGVATTIVCPGMIYGIGKGPIRKRGTTVPYLIEAILKRGKGFTVDEGRNVMSCIHIDDAASALLVLTEHALDRQRQQKLQNPSPATSTSSTFYFLSSSSNSTSMNDLTHSIINTAKSRNTIHSLEIERLSPGQAAQIHPWAPMLWGSNCAGESARLKCMGWEARGLGLFEGDVLGEMVDVEIRSLDAQGEERVKTWRVEVERKEEEVVCCF